MPLRVAPETLQEQTERTERLSFESLRPPPAREGFRSFLQWDRFSWTANTVSRGKPRVAGPIRILGLYVRNRSRYKNLHALHPQKSH